MNNIIIDFEEGSTVFDDVVYSWYISSSLNDYRLSLTFCGGINDYGAIDLLSSCFCDIELTEIGTNKPYILETVKDRLQEALSIEIESDTDLIYNSAPSPRVSISYRNEDSLQSSLNIAKAFLKHLTAVIDSQVDNIDLIIDDYIDFDVVL